MATGIGASQEKLLWLLGAALAGRRGTQRTTVALGLAPSFLESSQCLMYTEALWLDGSQLRNVDSILVCYSKMCEQCL